MIMEYLLNEHIIVNIVYVDGMLGIYCAYGVYYKWNHLGNSLWKFAILTILTIFGNAITICMGFAIWVVLINGVYPS